MANILTCPDHATILRSLGGGENPREIERVAAHLEGCASCGAVLDSLLHDHETVVALRDGTVVSEDSSAILRALHERLAGLVVVARPADRSDATIGVGAEQSGTWSSTPPADADAALTFLRPAQQPDEIGRLGSYRILKTLGAGGMGMVFLAEDTQLGRKVALKTMLPAVAQNPQNKQRFLREARAAAAIEHPHIVAIFQVGEDNGVPYLAMPLLKGESLEDRLRRTPKLPVAEALRIADEMAEGLAAAHAGGLIHRDIKPGNVWLESRPARGSAEGGFVVKLLDFGLARAMGDDTHLTQSGAIVGTPAFMAPEQARGLPVDGRADLFSLGCVLYAMITGERPFSGLTTMSLLTALALDTPKAPDAIDPLCPPELSRLTMHLLEKEPSKRPASARAVVDALAKIRGTDATEVIVLPAKPKTAPRAKPRKRRLLPLVAVGLMLALVGVGTFFGGTIFRIATNQGELVIDIDDKDVEIKIVKNGVVVQVKTAKREFTLTAGKGEIEVWEKDGVKLATKKFELTRNGKTTVTVTLGELAAARGAKPKIEPGPAKGGDPDRRAAEYVLSIGGFVRVNGQDRDIGAAADLPREPFRLTAVGMHGVQKLTDAGLAHLEGCKNLEYLDLCSTKVTDAGLAHLEDCKKLRHIDLAHTTGVSDAGLAYFKGCAKGLTHLDLLSVKVTDAGLADFADCKNLKWLGLSGEQVTDAGLATFKDCKGLTALCLLTGNMTDAGLAHFKDCKHLTHLRLSSTKVTNAGLAIFKDCKDLITLDLYDTPVTDAGLATFKDCKGLTRLTLSNYTKVSDAGLAHFAGCKNLTILALNDTPVGDAGLAHFKDCKSLTYLDLRKTKVTAAKIEESKKAFPACRIVWDGGIIEPKASPDPDRKAAEWVLSSGGVVRVNGQDREIKAATDLPKDAFRLTYVLLLGRQVTDEGLAHLNDCHSLTHLQLEDCAKVGEAGMAHLKGCKSLTTLALQLTDVGDAGIVHLKECKGLKSLALFGPRVTDEGLAHLKDCPSLMYLNLDFCLNVGDAGMAHLKGCKSLTDLILARMNVGDAGIAHLKECKVLKTLFLNSPRLTDAGLAHLKDCRNLTSLQVVGCVMVGDAGIAHLKECKGLKRLSLSGPRVTDAGMVHLKELGNLIDLQLDNVSVGDAGLAHLKECIGLQLLHLYGAEVTDAGMVHLKEIKSLGYLRMQNVKVSDAGLKILARLPNRPQALYAIDTRISKHGYERMQVSRPNFLQAWSETNRSVAEQVLALGGGVTIGTPGKDDARPVKAAADMPLTLFQVRRISLAGVTKPIDHLVNTLGLLRFAEFDRLESIDLSGTRPPYLTALTSVAGLRELSLSGAGLSDDWFANFPKLPTLRRLVIDGNPIGEPTLARLKQLPELRELSIGGPTMTDLVAQNLAGMKKLTKLSLAGSPLTDDCVEDLKALTALTALDLRKTNVSAAGIAELKKALPKCKIEWDGVPKGK